MKIKILLYTILNLIRNNPVKITYLMIVLLSLFFKNIVDKHIAITQEISNVIIIEGEDGDVEKYLYITKDGSSYDIFSREDPIEINDNLYLTEEFRVMFVIFTTIFYVFMIFLVVSFLVSLGEYGDDFHNLNDFDRASWDFISNYTYSKYKILKGSIIRKDDFNKIYFVLMGKIVFECGVDDEEYEHYKIAHNVRDTQLSDMYSRYKYHRNILKDFNGTISERREEGIDKILES